MKNLDYLWFALLLACLAGCSSSRKEEAKQNEVKEIQDVKDLPSGKSALTLTPRVQEKEDTIIFLLDARRNFKVEDEYIPDSEVLRVQVFSKKGAQIWNSSKDQVYMQVINPVNPELPGDTFTYSLEWNTVRDNGAKLQPGIYKVVMTIPAKPNPYVVDTELKWKTE